MPAKSIPEPWRSFFTEIDNSLHEELALHCLGGFVMTMLYGLDRPTADVDVLPLGVNSATESLMYFAGEGSALHRRNTSAIPLRNLLLTAKHRRQQSGGPSRKASSLQIRLDNAMPVLHEENYLFP